MSKSKIPIVIFAILLIMGIIFLIPGLILATAFAMIQDFDAPPMIIGVIFTLVGVAFCVASGVGLYLVINKQKKREMLKQTGTRITADYVETVVNQAVMIQYRHPFVIICEWNNPSDGKKYLFRSANIWFNPENVIKENGLTKFDVYYDEKNMRDYVVDIDCITKNVVDFS